MAKRLTARGFVGREIRRARETVQPRMSRKALGQLVSVSGELVAAWESGRQAVLHDHIVNLIKVLDFGPELMVRVVDDLVDGATTPEFEEKWLEAERVATQILAFESGVIPGLLQTPEYARSVLTDENQLTQRLHRQKILQTETSPTFVALLSEAVLHLAAGSREVMAAQMDHLAECADLESVFVHVIPMTEPVSGKFTGPFMVATLEDGRNVGYGPSAIGSGEVYELPEHIAELQSRFNRFRAPSLSGQQSIDLIRRVAEQWK